MAEVREAAGRSNGRPDIVRWGAIVVVALWVIGIVSSESSNGRICEFDSIRVDVHAAEAMRDGKIVDLLLLSFACFDTCSNIQV